jgi:hypothetical protein
MRIPLTFPRSLVDTATAPRVSPPKQILFADRLAAGRKPEPKQPTLDASNPALADDSEAQAVAALRERIKEYLQQIELMHQIMCTPGPLPDRDTD